MNHGKLVTLECLGKASGYRFLDGRLLDSTVGLAPAAMGRFTGTRWLLSAEGNAVTLKCLGELDGPSRYLDGVQLDRRVQLAPHTAPPFTGTRWEMAKVDNPHSDVEPGFLATFRCLGAVGGDSYLDGIMGYRAVGLAPHTAEPYNGTLWRVLPAWPYFEPCPSVQEDPANRTVDVVRTVRIGQVTGTKDPQRRPLVNGDTSVLGVPGVDLGATAEDGHGRLFVFFGDVVQGERRDGPAVDADAVAFTVDGAVDERLETYPDGGGGGIRLNFVMSHDDQYFDPFRVEGPIGITGTFEVPSGAFSHENKMLVFFHTADTREGTRPAGCYLASKTAPGQPGPFREELLFSPRPMTDGMPGPDAFGGVAPVKVRKADHPWLPDDPEADAEEGLVLFGIGSNRFHDWYSAIHLAWMPLDSELDVTKVRYFTGYPDQWSARAEDARALFGKQTNLQSISASYLPGPKKWIVVHMTSNGTNCPTGPIVARIGSPPLDWSEEFRLFDPCRERAYGTFMHWPGLDNIQLDDPFRTPPSAEQRPAMELDRADNGPGNAYGAFILPRYSRWKADSATLDLYHLLSLWSPYQVQLMRTTLRLGVTIPGWLTKTEVESGDEMGGWERKSAAELDLIVNFDIAQHEPGYDHEQVIGIDPPPGTFVMRGSIVTVFINLEG